MSQSPNHVTLEKYIELMNNFVEIKTELVSKKDEILESRIENFRNYVYLQKEKDAAILEERTRFDEVSVKIKETSENMENKINKNSEHLDKKFIETSENMENKINKNSEHLETKINEISEHLETKIKEISEHLETKIKEISEHLDKKFIETSENMENKINKNSEHLEKKINETSENMENKINKNSEHLETKFIETSEKIENKIYDTSKRIDKVEVKIDDVLTLLQNIATNFNNMNHQYVNIAERVEKLEKKDEKSIDLPPVVSTQYDVREQEMFIDDFIDKVKELNLKKQGEIKEINKKIIYLNNYKLLIKFSVARDDIYYFVYVRLSLMKGDLDEVIKWPCEERIEVRVIERDGEIKWWERFNYGDKDKSWRNRVREGDIGEESERGWIIGRTLKDYEDEILFGDKLKIKIKIE